MTSPIKLVVIVDDAENVHKKDFIVNFSIRSLKLCWPFQPNLVWAAQHSPFGRARLLVTFKAA